MSKEAPPAPKKPPEEQRTEELREIVMEDIKEQRELIEDLRRKLIVDAALSVASALPTETSLDRRRKFTVIQGGRSS